MEEILNLKITGRAIAGAILSFLVITIFGRKFIRFLLGAGVAQKVSQWGPKEHMKKEGIPTSFGIFIFAVSLGIYLALARWEKWVAPVLVGFALFTALGFLDDFLKKRTKKRGLTVKQKLAFQFLFSAIVVLWLLKLGLSTELVLPFLKEKIYLPEPVFFVFACFVVVGTSNAVNLTDGLDGLAGGHLIVAFAVVSVLTYLAGHSIFAKYLDMVYVRGAGELAVLSACVIGALFGFLWFNSYPAEVFMGDSGSLSLGALLALISLVAKVELFLPIFGGIFVAEALSVIVQVSYFKLTGGKRIFKMTPLHHHFELSGWAEPKIVVRFLTIAIFLGAFSLLALKIRV